MAPPSEHSQPSEPSQPSLRPSALAWMNAQAAELPELLIVRDLGRIVWQALILDGVARVVRGDVALPADRPETPPVRAVAAQPLVPTRAVVGRAAAVWVHTGGPAPGRIDVLVAPRARRPDPHPERVAHESVLTAADVVAVGPLRVTTVERTAVDVARWAPEDEADRLLTQLTVHGDLDPGDALALLDGLAGHRGTLHARRALLGVAAEPEPLAPPPAGPTTLDR